MTCQPLSVLYGPPICPSLRVKADSASAGWAPIDANIPSRVTVPRLPPFLRVSVSAEYFSASLFQS